MKQIIEEIKEHIDNNNETSAHKLIGELKDSFDTKILLMPSDNKYNILIHKRNMLVCVLTLNKELRITNEIYNEKGLDINNFTLGFSSINKPSKRKRELLRPQLTARDMIVLLEQDILLKGTAEGKRKYTTTDIVIVECDSERTIIKIHQSHRVLAAELNIELKQFLRWYVRPERMYKNKYYLMSKGN